MLTVNCASTIIFAIQAPEYGGGGGGGLIAGLMSLLSLALAVVVIVAAWKIFSKAGKPGWAAIVPIYNLVVLLQIVKRPLWWIILLCIPFVNLVAAIILSVDLAKVFGKGIGFAIGLIIVPIVFYPILGFGDARYQG
jgi:hypothetical protein